MFDEHHDRLCTGRYGGFKELHITPSAFSNHMDHVLEMFRILRSSNISTYSDARRSGVR